jgi:hypothetical protein
MILEEKYYEIMIKLREKWRSPKFPALLKIAAFKS